MANKLDEYRAKAIAREFMSNGNNKTKAMRSIKDKNGKQVYADGYCQSDRGHKTVFNNMQVKAEITRLEAESAAEAKITREIQHAKLTEAFNIAKGKKNAAAMTGAIREQNEMLGYHRETAPNTEREEAKRARTEAEQTELERLAAKRTSELTLKRIG